MFENREMRRKRKKNCESSQKYEKKPDIKKLQTLKQKETYLKKKYGNLY